MELFPLKPKDLCSLVFNYSHPDGYEVISPFGFDFNHKKETLLFQQHRWILRALSEIKKKTNKYHMISLISESKTKTNKTSKEKQKNPRTHIYR